MEGPYEKRRDATIRQLFLDPPIVCFSEVAAGGTKEKVVVVGVGGYERGAAGMILVYCVAIQPPGWTAEFISYLQRCLDNGSIIATLHGWGGWRAGGW